MYLRTCSNSKPTVDTAYPRAQKCSPVKFRSLPHKRAIAMALFPFSFGHPFRWLCDPETPSEISEPEDSGGYNRAHDTARQLRPIFLWSVSARLSAWLRDC